MHEIERQRIILGEVADQAGRHGLAARRPDGRIGSDDPSRYQRASRDGKLRKVRGGAEALHPPQTGRHRRSHLSPSTRPSTSAQKRAIAQAAVELCEDGDSIIINGGTTTFQMVHHLARPPDADPDQFLRHRRTSGRSIRRTRSSLPGGAIYREQSLILSPFENDVTRNFYARRMFMGAQGVSPIGVMEGDPLLIQAEQKLINQADELILLVDSTKFDRRSSLILCPLDRVDTIITDSGISDSNAKMVEQAGIRLIVAEATADEEETESSVA